MEISSLKELAGMRVAESYLERWEQTDTVTKLMLGALCAPCQPLEDFSCDLFGFREEDPTLVEVSTADIHCDVTEEHLRTAFISVHGVFNDSEIVVILHNNRPRYGVITGEISRDSPYTVTLSDGTIEQRYVTAIAGLTV